MSDIALKAPSAEYAEQIMAYRQEFLDANDEMDGCGGLHGMDDPIEWIKKCESYSNSETCPRDKVTSNQYIAVRKGDDRIVGMIDLRHSIENPILAMYGGHIGYSVRVDERRKGYAKEMLRLCLAKARERGMVRVMVTCNDDNIGSEKTILANGGVFHHKITVEEINETMKVFWIEL